MGDIALTSLGIPPDVSVTTNSPSETPLTNATPSRSSTGRGWLICLLALVAGIGVDRLIHRRSIPEFPAYLQSRVCTVTADCDATVVGIDVAEGDHVSAGTPLISLKDRSLERRITEQRQTLALLESELQQAMARAELELLVRLREIDEEVMQADLQASNFLREQFACELEHSMLADVISDGSMAAIWNDSDPVFRSTVLGDRVPESEQVQTVLRMELMANSAEVLAAQVEMCDHRRDSLEHLKADLPSMVQRSVGVQTIETRISEVRSQLEDLETESVRLSAQATAFGIVGLFRVGEGAVVTPGTPLVDILDDERRFLVAHVSSRYISEFTKGDVVDLVFPGGQRLQGVVERIAPQAQIETLDPRTSDDSIVLVDIAPSGRVWPTVPIGSQVKVLVQE